MTRPRILLASTSRYRRDLFARLGLPFEAVAPDFDEDAAKQELAGKGSEAIVRALALGKARAVAASAPDALVIGSDQAAAIDGELLGKPGTEEGARAQLRLLAGRTHRLLTAVALVHGGAAEEALDVHRLTMRALDDAAIADYVRRDAPLDCAGAYRVESLGIALFERIEGHDFTAIVGLPLTLVVAMLERVGVRVLGAQPLA